MEVDQTSSRLNKTIVNSQEDMTSIIITTIKTNTILGTNKIIIRLRKKTHLLTYSTEQIEMINT